MTEPECVFCKIYRNEISSEELFSNDRIKVFKDINPGAPVHMLIIPRRHIESVMALTEDDADVMSDLLLGAKKTGQMLKLEGYKLIFNVGRKGGQVIDHIHLHLLGGWKSDSERGTTDVLSRATHPL